MLAPRVYPRLCQEYSMRTMFSIFILFDIYILYYKHIILYIYLKRQMHHDSLLCQVFWMACTGSPIADAPLGPIYVCCVSPPLLHVFHDRRPIEPIVICTPWMIRGILVKACSDRFALCSSERFDFQSQHLHQQALCCVGSRACNSLPRLPLL